MAPTTYVYATYIRTTPEKLWEALTNGDFTEKYWFGFRLELEPRTGGIVRFVPPKGSPKRMDPGQVLEFDPCNTLSYSWVPDHGYGPEFDKKRNGPTRVTFELTPVGQNVRLRVIHENLVPEDSEPNPNTLKGINNGWPAVMSSLKSLLETGEAISMALPPAQSKSDLTVVA